MWDVLTNFDPAVLIAFIGAGLLLNITPGADFVFVSASGISGGPRVGMAAALGINLGVGVHIVMAAAGVSAALIAYPAAYSLIKYAGATYLVFLAVQAWRSTGEIGEGHAATRLLPAVKRGFLTNILNPKTALFIFAFIPQFTDPAIGPIWMQILILGALFLLFGFAFSLSLGVAAGVFSNALRARVKTLNKITALLFGGLAAKLVLD
ncbi:LysE family translocator [Amylibacter sp. IMCC11727]|uniref:LysE family translocator n=1 Tax=Amylibacter sp. IMCC11727 TaxID=3039851 RepID=UPI00244DFA89|nr:LysE family translocator [Amylibacter sp. IMCC11727]WGI22331.1 LysE family translocator [Amylibacter sp. IMCC11727]